MVEPRLMRRKSRRARAAAQPARQPVVGALDPDLPVGRALDRNPRSEPALPEGRAIRGDQSHLMRMEAHCNAIRGDSGHRFRGQSMLWGPTPPPRRLPREDPVAMHEPERGQRPVKPHQPVVRPRRARPPAAERARPRLRTVQPAEGGERVVREVHQPTDLLTRVLSFC